MGYLIKDTTKEERIALIKSWIPNDEAMDGSDIDLWDMYADYIGDTAVGTVLYVLPKGVLCILS